MGAAVGAGGAEVVEDEGGRSAGQCPRATHGASRSSRVAGREAPSWINDKNSRDVALAYMTRFHCDNVVMWIERKLC